VTVGTLETRGADTLGPMDSSAANARARGEELRGVEYKLGARGPVGRARQPRGTRYWYPYPRTVSIGDASPPSFRRR
jgi:hypothetical protein